jgi:hypothetical protein
MLKSWSSLRFFRNRKENSLDGFALFWAQHNYFTSNTVIDDNAWLSFCLQQTGFLTAGLLMLSGEKVLTDFG